MEVLLAGGEGVGEKGWMDRWFVHGGGGGGQRSCDWWSSLLCGDCGFVFGELEWGEFSEAGHRRLIKWREEGGCVGLEWVPQPYD